MLISDFQEIGKKVVAAVVVVVVVSSLRSVVSTASCFGGAFGALKFYSGASLAWKNTL